MGPGVGLPFIAEEAISRGMALMIGTSYPQVKITTGANVKIIGYALNDAAIGQEVAVHPVTNGAAKCKALAGASFDRGDILVGEGNDGRVAKLTPSGTTQYGCGIALEDGDDGQLVDILPCFFVVDTGA